VLIRLCRGQYFPIHPLDLSDIAVHADDNGNNVTVCVSTMGALPGSVEYDSLFGDTFMRNFYSVYDSPPTVHPMLRLIIPVLYLS
jgi:hypothetical protein